MTQNDAASPDRAGATSPAAPPCEPTSSPEAALGPVRAAERIEIVDIVRGAAIFGIFVVNIGALGAPMALHLVHPDQWSGWVNRFAEFLVVFLAQGKFYTIFSFLFGLGLAIQMSRVESRGGRFAPLCRRRLLALLAIGLAHAFLIWMGDILATYAILGFVLMSFLRRSEHVLASWIVVCLLAPLLVSGLGLAAEQVGWYQPVPGEQVRELRQQVDDSLEVYAGGSFARIMERRALDAFVVLALTAIFGAAHILAIFLAGLWAGRRRIFEDVPAHAPLLARARNVALLPGLAASFAAALMFRSVKPFDPSWSTLAFQACSLIGAMGLSVVYLTGLTLLARRDAWRQRLRPLAAVGRTALSNYLLQSAAGTFVFYGYGLALYGKVPPAAGLLLAVAFYAIQVLLSNWWLRRFRFGPAEWLWRSLTYARLQPMRV